MGRARRAATTLVRALRGRTALVDAGVACVLSVAGVVALPHGGRPVVTAAAAACTLAATTSAGWRGRAPEAAVVVAGAGLAGCAWLAGGTGLLPDALALLLASYTAGARGVSRRQVGQLALLAGYAIAALTAGTAVTGRLSVAAVAVRALPLVVAPALTGLLVARQRALASRLAAAAGRLRAQQQARLAVVALRERNRVARDLHDVVTHGVSVMVVQAGAARITAGEEPEVARAALGEVTGAGRTALAELRRILGITGAGDEDGAGPPFGVSGIVALTERRRAGGLPVRMTVTGTAPGRPGAVLSGQLDAAVFRLVQEALTNVVKHARSAATEVDLTFQPGTLRVLVRNQAPGLAPSAGGVGVPAQPVLAAGTAMAGGTGPACGTALAGAVAQPSGTEPGSGPAQALDSARAGGTVQALGTGEAFETALAGAGRGLTGMRERVEACGGRLRCGAEPGGGFAVRAELPLPPGGLRAGSPAAGTGDALSQVIASLRAAQPWAGVAVAFSAGCADAWLSADRTGPLALNIALVAGMSLALLWRRRAPLAFLVAVNLLALPISNGLASISNPTLVSTFVFVVPVWTVAAWSAAPAAAAGLALTAAFDVGEGLYWQLGTASITVNVLLGCALWIAGRVLRGQRLMATELRRTNVALEAEQQARESLIRAEERTRMVARLHTLVAEEVSAMVVAAESVRDLIGVDNGAATAAIGEIERTGRQSLTQLREVLGVLRAEYDPDPLPS